MRWLTLSLGVPLMFFVPSCSAATGAECGRTSDWQGKVFSCLSEDFTITPGADLTIDGGPNGGVELTVSDSPVVRVTATRTTWIAPAEDRAAKFRSIQILQSSTELKSENLNPTQHDAWGVSFKLTVPRSLPIVIKTVNGAVTAIGLRANLSVWSVNGSIKVSGFGGATSVSSVNGNINLNIPVIEPYASTLAASSENGSIKLLVAKDAPLYIRAKSTLGQVSVDPALGHPAPGGRRYERGVDGSRPSL